MRLTATCYPAFPPDDSTGEKVCLSCFTMDFLRSFQGFRVSHAQPYDPWGFTIPPSADFGHFWQSRSKSINPDCRGKKTAIRWPEQAPPWFNAQLCLSSAAAVLEIDQGHQELHIFKEPVGGIVFSRTCFDKCRDPSRVLLVLRSWAHHKLSNMFRAGGLFPPKKTKWT